MWVEPAYNILIPSWRHKRESIAFACRGEVTFEEGEKEAAFVTRYLAKKQTNREDVSSWTRGLISFQGV